MRVIDAAAKHQPTFSILRSVPRFLQQSSAPVRDQTQPLARSLSINSPPRFFTLVRSIWFRPPFRYDRRQVALLHSHIDWNVMGDAVKDKAPCLCGIPVSKSVGRGCQAHHFYRGVANFQIGNKAIVSRSQYSWAAYAPHRSKSGLAQERCHTRFPDRLDASKGNGAV